MSVQDKVEENIGTYQERAVKYVSADNAAVVWALLAIAESLYSIRELLRTGNAFVTTYDGATA